MSGIWQWVKWECGRTIEVRGFMKWIIVERLAKATVLILGGVSLLLLGATSEWTKLLQALQEQVNFNPTHHGLWSGLLNSLIVKMQLWSGGTQTFIAIGAMLYGLLEGVEGVGLVKRRRWAEYLVLVATVVFIPLEIDELMRRFTIVKLGLFGFNVAIVFYLVWRKRLFLERPGMSHLDLSTDSA